MKDLAQQEGNLRSDLRALLRHAGVLDKMTRPDFEHLCQLYIKEYGVDSPASHKAWQVMRMPSGNHIYLTCYVLDRAGRRKGENASKPCGYVLAQQMVFSFYTTE